MNARRHAPATARNRGPILDVLKRILPDAGLVLEVASGTGEHAVHFAPVLHPLIWQPSDRDPDLRASVSAWAAETGVPLPPPLDLDVTAPRWPVEDGSFGPIVAVVAINLIHIAPWEATLGLFAGADRLLGPDGIVYLYGPYRRDGEHTAPSNAAFDASLRSQNPAWGVRDMGEVADVAARHGFRLDEIVAMPANNFSLIFRRTAR
ncbi:MAG TPA: DUF938 domain-containing protein [Sphingomonadales bacterium]